MRGFGRQPEQRWYLSKSTKDHQTESQHMKLFKRKKESASGDEKSPEPVTSPVEVPNVAESNKIKKHVLVIDTVKHDWDALFSQVTHDRFDFVLDQCEWKDIASVTSYNEYSSRKGNGRICTVHMHAEASSKVKARTQLRHFQPDFVIVRKLVNGLKIKSEVCNRITNINSNRIGQTHCKVFYTHKYHQLTHSSLFT